MFAYSAGHLVIVIYWLNKNNKEIKKKRKHEEKHGFSQTEVFLASAVHS